MPIPFQPMWRAQPMQQNKTGPTPPPAPAAPPAPDADTADDVSPATVAPDKGFPAATKVADMEPAQQAAYWRFQARKHEDVVKARADYDDLKKFKETADADKLSDHEKAVIAAREEGKTEATTSALTRAATAILKAGLKARGVEDKEIPDLLDAFNAAKFIKDGDVDTDRVAALASRMAGPVKDGKTWPDMGAGKRQGAPLSGRDAGLEEAQRRFGKPA